MDAATGTKPTISGLLRTDAIWYGGSRSGGRL